MLANLLASLGVGAARIDAVPDSRSVTPGGSLRGRIQVRGGRVAQEIRDIEIRVETLYEVEINDRKRSADGVVGRSRLGEAFTIEPGEERGVPFEIPIPFAAPLTLGDQPVWIRSSLDIGFAVDPKDRDPIQVVPTPLQQRLIEALESLGFTLHRARCEASRLGRGLPFVQELEMRPYSGPFARRLDEIDVVLFPEAGRLGVHLEVDRRPRGLGSWVAEALDMDESRFQLTFQASDLQRPVADWAEQLSQAIARGA